MADLDITAILLRMDYSDILRTHYSDTTQNALQRYYSERITAILIRTHYSDTIRNALERHHSEGTYLSNALTWSLIL